MTRLLYLLLAALIAGAAWSGEEPVLLAGQGMGPGPGVKAYSAGGAPPAYKAMFTQTTPNSSCTVSGISGVNAHDTLVMAAVGDSNSAETWTYPSGSWTEIAKTNISGDGLTMSVGILTDAAGGESSLTLSNTGTTVICAVWVFSGADNSSYATAKAFTHDLASDSSANASPWSLASASRTPAGNNALLLVVMADDVRSGGGTVSHSFATTTGSTGAWTNPGDVSDGGFRQMALGYATQASAGAFVVTGTGTEAAHSSGIVLVTIGLQSASP